MQTSGRIYQAFLLETTNDNWFGLHRQVILRLTSLESTEEVY